MRPFTITRIHTTHGVFRLKGQIIEHDVPSSQSSRLQIDCLDILGTDGWIILKINDPATETLILSIQDACLQHLKPEP